MMAENGLSTVSSCLVLNGYLYTTLKHCRVPTLGRNTCSRYSAYNFWVKEWVLFVIMFFNKSLPTLASNLLHANHHTTELLLLVKITQYFRTFLFETR